MMKPVALMAAIAAAPSSAATIPETWGANDCRPLNEVMSFDADAGDPLSEEYAQQMIDFAQAFGFLHGYAVANGWHEVEGFDYVAEFRETCGEYPDRAPQQVLIHLF